MAPFALSLLLLAFTVTPSSATWCVCKDGSDPILQKTLDYACGAGADCNPLRQNAPCFQPNTVKAHCSYAVNSYFQKKGQVQGSCDFAGAATVTASDPSVSGCVYPSSASSSGSTSTGTTPATGTGTTTPSMGTTPSTGTPSTGTGTGSSTGTGMGSSTGTGSGTGSSTGTGTGTGTGSGSIGTTPYGATPGVLGGIGSGMGPSGAGMDDSHGGLTLIDTSFLSSFYIALFSALVMFW